MNTQQKDKIVVLYHAQCFDGRMAAWAVYDNFFGDLLACDEKLLLEENNEVSTPDTSVKFIPINYNDPLPEFDGETVYVVDFSDDVEKLLAASVNTERMIVIDHHASMRDKFMNFQEGNHEMGNFILEPIMEDGKVVNFQWASHNGKLYAYFDNRFSGAMLTWMHFDLRKTEDAPTLLQYAQDYDLFKFEFEGTREIAAAMYDQIGEMSFSDLDHLIERCGIGKPDKDAVNETLANLYEAGVIIHAHQKSLANGIIKRGVKYVDYQGHKIPICQAPRELRTLVGELLAKDHYFSVSYEDYCSIGIREYSFRSNKKNHDFCDVKKLAESFGGGGHVNAAGVRVKLDIGDILFPESH